MVVHLVLPKKKMGKSMANEWVGERRRREIHRCVQKTAMPCNTAGCVVTAAHSTPLKGRMRDEFGEEGWRGREGEGEIMVAVL